MTIEPGNGPNDPPWNRAPLQQNTCSSDNASGVNSNFFAGLYPSFCSSLDTDRSKKGEKTLTNADLKLPSMKRSLGRRTPPPNSKMYNGYKFNFKWEPSSGGQCSDTCEDAYAMIVRDLCKFPSMLHDFKPLNISGGHLGGQQNEMGISGQANVNCGVYSYTIDRSPEAEAIATLQPPPPAPTTATNTASGTCVLTRHKESSSFFLSSDIEWSTFVISGKGYFKKDDKNDNDKFKGLISNNCKYPVLNWAVKRGSGKDQTEFDWTVEGKLENERTESCLASAVVAMGGPAGTACIA